MNINKELVILKMQKPARLLAVLFKILFIFAIIGTAIGTIAYIGIYSAKDAMIDILSDPAVESTLEVQDTLALYAAFDLPTTVLITLYTALTGVLGVLSYHRLTKIFREISEERATLMRTSYAKGLRFVAIMMLSSSIITQIFSFIAAAHKGLHTATGGEISSDGLLLVSVVLLVVSYIYQYAVTLHEIRDTELRAEGAAEARGESVPPHIFDEARAATEADTQEDKTVFEGF